MEIRCAWDASYSVGDEELDRQHRRMFDLVNALPERLEPDLVRQLTFFLLRHAAEHFSAEEERMKVIAYPRLDEHRGLHDALVAEVGRYLQQRFDNDDEVAAFKAFVNRWVTEHILVHDMDYFRFELELRRQGRNRWAMQCGGERRACAPGPLAVKALDDQELARL